MSELPVLAAARRPQLHWAVQTYPTRRIFSGQTCSVPLFFSFTYKKQGFFFFCDELSHKPVQRRRISWVLVNREVCAYQYSAKQTMIFHNSVCFITQYFSNCTSCEEVDGTWRHAQIRIHLQGFSAGLCWAQAVLPLLYVISSSVIREVKGTSVLYISAFQNLLFHAPALSLKACLIFEHSVRSLMSNHNMASLLLHHNQHPNGKS